MSNHARFQRHLANSRPAVRLVCEWLMARGVRATVMPNSVAPEHADWKAHRDRGDIMATVRVEVKHLGCTFTCREDWPYPDFIVCAKHAFDQARPKPWAFIYVAQQQTHLAFLPAQTWGRWWVEARTDRRYDEYTQDFYICSPDEPIFVKLAA